MPEFKVYEYTRYLGSFRDPSPGLSFVPVGVAYKVTRIIVAPEGSSVRDVQGSQAKLKVPKHGNEFDCWLFEPEDALRLAESGKYGLSLKVE